MDSSSEKKHIYYDTDRKLNLVRVHDGGGNMYVFNCPPDVTLKVKEVLKCGELVSYKMKGSTNKRIDSSADPYFRKYNMVVPLESKNSGLDPEEFESLLEERKKRAPIPGQETKYPPYLAQRQGAEPEPRVAAEEAAPTAQDSVITSPPAAPREHGKAIGKFKGEDVYRPDASRTPYLLKSKPCHHCHQPIEGKCPVSLDGKGRFTRLQAFVPFGIVRQVAAGSDKLLCESCISAKDHHKAPVKNVIPPKPADTLAPEPPAGDEPATVQGFNFFKFERRGEDYFYKGNKILEREDGLRYLRNNPPCRLCNQPIELEATVAFHDGKPWTVGSQRPVHKGSAAPAAPRSPLWQHTSCPGAVSASPTPVATPVAAPLTAEHSLDPERPWQEVKGEGYFKFKKQGESYYYRDRLIQGKTINWKGQSIVSHSATYEQECQLCHQPLHLVAGITYKNGKPATVSAARSLSGDARPVMPRSHNWAHNACLDAQGGGDQPPGLIAAVGADLNGDSGQTSPHESPEHVIGGANKALASEPERELAPPPVAAHHPHQHMPAPIELSPQMLALIQRMKQMALDSSINAEVFRGAAYMLLLSLGGDDANE